MVSLLLYDDTVFGYSLKTGSYRGYVYYVFWREGEFRLRTVLD